MTGTLKLSFIYRRNNPSTKIVKNGEGPVAKSCLLFGDYGIE